MHFERYKTYLQSMTLKNTNVVGIIAITNSNHLSKIKDWSWSEIFKDKSINITPRAYFWPLPTCGNFGQLYRSVYPNNGNRPWRRGDFISPLLTGSGTSLIISDLSPNAISLLPYILPYITACARAITAILSAHFHWSLLLSKAYSVRQGYARAVTGWLGKKLWWKTCITWCLSLHWNSNSCPWRPC